MSRFIQIAFCILLPFLSSCRDNNENKNILYAEQMLDTDPSVSLKILQRIDTSCLSSADKSLFSLVKTMAMYKCDIPIESDSLINIALHYYTSGPRFVQSMIFKGIVESEIGNEIGAVVWLKKAEAATDRNDYETLGYINMQIGNIYLDSYIENKEDIKKYKKALLYYTKSRNRKRCQVLNGIIGGSYRSYDIDSAYKYLSNAIALDFETKDSSLLFLHTEMLARAYYQDSNFLKSKNLALFAIQEGQTSFPPEEAVHDAARAYAQLGNIDSAKYFQSRLNKRNLSPQENVKLLTTDAIIAEKEGDFKKALIASKEASEIADSIVNASHQQQLFLKEKLFDTQILKSENTEIRHRKTMILIIFIFSFITLGCIFIVVYQRKQKQIKNATLLQEQFQIAHRLAMEDMVKQKNISYDLHTALADQISIVKQLIEKSYYFGNQAGKFNDAFQRMMRINTPDGSFWKGLKIHTNIVFDGIVTKMENEFPSLTNQDIYFICMLLCDFSSAEIIVCMGYTNSHSVNNRQLRIAQKLNLGLSLNEFIHKVKNNEFSHGSSSFNREKRFSAN